MQMFWRHVFSPLSLSFITPFLRIPNLFFLLYFFISFIISDLNFDWLLHGFLIPNMDMNEQKRHSLSMKSEKKVWQQDKHKTH